MLDNSLTQSVKFAQEDSLTQRPWAHDQFLNIEDIHGCLGHQRAGHKLTCSTCGDTWQFGALFRRHLRQLWDPRPKIFAVQRAPHVEALAGGRRTGDACELLERLTTGDNKLWLPQASDRPSDLADFNPSKLAQCPNLVGCGRIARYVITRESTRTEWN